MNDTALYLMFLLGSCTSIFGCLIASEMRPRPTWAYPAVLVWFLIWCGPPLAHLWIKGVLGQ